MKTSSLSRTGMRAPAAKAAALAGCLLLPGGCLMNDGGGDGYESDGSIGFMNQEANSLGEALSVDAGAKIAGRDGDRHKEVIVKSLGYDSACQCFVRTSSFSHTNPHGKQFTRFRSDSIWLDSAGQFLTRFRPRNASTITHHRHVIKINGAMDIDVHINATMTWAVEDDGDTVRIWNGTITGTYDGVPFKDGKMNGVIHSFFAGFWVPTGGRMHFKRGDFDIDLAFEGSGKAQAEVKGRGKTKRIHCDGGDETEEG